MDTQHEASENERTRLTERFVRWQDNLRQSLSSHVTLIVGWSAGGLAFCGALYDGSSMRLYTNGVLTAQTSTSGRIDINSKGVGIGSGNAADGTDYFEGYIDDIRIYNRALNPAEIQQLYTSP